MGQIKRHWPVNPVRNLFLLSRKRGISNGVKLIIGLIFKEDNLFNKTKVILEKCFGKIDFESQTFPFIHTTYYEKEFGKNLKRRFLSFKRLVSPQDLSQIKIITHKLENKLSIAGCRTINIDPGYLDYSKLLLASTKDYRHRIYLNQGIYAEVTLFYKDKTFQPWEWTYPDYKTKEYIEVFNLIREIYTQQMKDK